MQDADPFRVRAYTEAAAVVEALGRPVANVLRDGGLDALIALPAIGPSIASAIAEMVDHGYWRQLDRLRGDLTPERLFRTLPGIGPVLARRLADDHDCATIQDLERVLNDRMRSLAGVGPRRRAALLSAIRDRLSHLPHKHATRDEPGIEALLEIDRRYRDGAAAGVLTRIAPKRFNPEGKAWLPILHTMRDGWHVTALFSNTALAHKLDRTGDWVVVHFHRDTGAENQRTVVTETRGDLSGHRVVRGREAECRQHYGKQSSMTPVNASPTATG
jgi:hypothetical protein